MVEVWRGGTGKYCAGGHLSPVSASQVAILLLFPEDFSMNEIVFPLLLLGTLPGVNQGARQGLPLRPCQTWSPEVAGPKAGALHVPVSVALS